MYAIIEAGGKQYRVEEGSVLNIADTIKKPGDIIEFSNILLLVDNEKVEVGRPYVDKATVFAEVRKHLKGRKTMIFKKRRRKDYKKIAGHRQNYTEIRIREIKTA